MPKINLKTPHLSVQVDTDQGAEIVAVAGSDGRNVLYLGDWKAPLPARMSRTYGNETLDWLSEYRGGWQELFPNGGGGGTVLGVPIPFHGEVSRAVWEWEWLQEGVSIRMSCPARLPLVLERTMRLDPSRPVLYIEERVTNESEFEVPYLWGHHPAYGPPVADTGARIDLPAGKVVADAGLDTPYVDLVPGSEHTWPIAQNRAGERVDLSVIPTPAIQRLIYIADLFEPWYALRNPSQKIGVGLAWEKATFPHMWLWQEIGGAGMPWYGRARITALEPATQWPSYGLAKAVENGTAHLLAPGQVAETRLTCVVFEASEKAVTGIGLDGSIRLAK